MSAAIKELTYFSHICHLSNSVSDIPILYGDSTAAIQATKAEVSNSLKHQLHLKFYYFRVAYREGKIDLTWIPTKDQVADVLTKALPESSFNNLTQQLLNDV